MSKQKGLSTQSGIIHPLPIFLVVLIITIGLLVFYSREKISLKKIVSNINPFKKEVSVELQASYQNPFDTQYVNPFSTSKNPFDALK